MHHPTSEQSRNEDVLTGLPSTQPNTGVMRINRTPYEYFYIPDSPPSQIILYINGDAELTHCTPEQQRSFAARFALVTKKRVLPIYPFSGTIQPFPEPLMQVESIYTGLFNEGYRTENIVLGADSTAGGLALALMLLLKEKSILLPKAVFLFSPCLDLTLSGASLESKAINDIVLSKDKLLHWAMRYYGGNDPRNPFVSPIFGDFRNFPSTLIHVGDNEILLSDSETFAKKAKAAGVDIQLKVWELMHHAWYTYFENSPQVEEAIQEVGIFINKHIPLKPQKKIYGPEDFL